MFLILRRDWAALDATGDTTKKAVIPAGRHEVERIPNPCGHKDSYWLVLKGTRIGGGEKFWRQWQKSRGAYKVIIEK